MTGSPRELGCTDTHCGLTENDSKGARAIYTSPNHVAH